MWTERRLTAGRSVTGGTVALLAVGVVLVLAVVAAVTRPADGLRSADPSGEDRAVAVPDRAAYTHLQMNLCLSGMAGCYPRDRHDEAIAAAVDAVRRTGADVVTLNEICRADVRRIARRVGYHLRFAIVVYAGERLPCVDPGGRGLFGNAILTRDRVIATAGRPFASQAGPEERRWMCVTTRRGTVCGAHLEARLDDPDRVTNRAQCAEVGRVLTLYAARGRPVTFGGDMNRLSSCAPPGFWTRTDWAGGGIPGVQHVYGSRSLTRPVARVVRADLTDHDFLAVEAR
jgi:hypothetical protein